MFIGEDTASIIELFMIEAGWYHTEDNFLDLPLLQ